MVPFVILVGIDKAWKKEVFSGPRPVFVFETNTSTGAIAPALAGASFWLLNNTSLISNRSSFVKTKPTFPIMCGNSLEFGRLT